MPNYRSLQNTELRRSESSITIPTSYFYFDITIDARVRQGGQTRDRDEFQPRIRR
ncbi:MAG: hypothetical protein J7641_00450 [Cyanobacteria bacterium SID2]|nr:hypothetical protein [Cyanobacteria bacterium SID2]